MIEPTKEDIGRGVIYRPPHAKTPEFDEAGIITSFNDHFVFVRYSVIGNGVATKREDLEFV